MIALCLVAFTVGAASALKMHTESESEAWQYLAMDHTVVTTFDTFKEDAPEWCRNETNLTWTQRKQRMQQHATLAWAKQEQKKLAAANQSIPGWMDKMLTDDANRGKLKWASQECKRLRSEGKEVPQWMAQLETESNKWANRWAACKAAELKAQGEEPPAWMIDNGRKGIMDYADEKAADLQAQIDELEEAKQKEEALVDAHGDVKSAGQRMFASTKALQVRSLDQQFNVLELALVELGNAENNHDMPAPRMKQAMKHAKEAYEMFGRALQHKFATLRAL